MFRRNPAGRSSMAKFHQERRANIRDEWAGIAIMIALTLAALVWVILGTGVGQLLTAFAFGVGVTGLGFGWMLGFDAHSLRWTWGAFGEQWTAEELAKLGSGWHVSHDIPDGRGNWDHVVVGPPGVFVVDSKFLTEPAAIDANGLRAGRLRAGGGAATRGSAVRMKEIIERETGLSVWVQGIVAVWGRLPEGVVERDKVLYVPAGRLVETLQSRPEKLTDVQCIKVLTAIQSLADGI
jgi:hypothetical protein